MNIQNILFIFSLFWLYNYSDILSFLRKFIISVRTNLVVRGKVFLVKVYDKLTYPLTCSYCFAFWFGLLYNIDKLNALGYYRVISIALCLAAANLFMDLVFRNLIWNMKQKTDK